MERFQRNLVGELQGILIPLRRAHRFRGLAANELVEMRQNS